MISCELWPLVSVSIPLAISFKAGFDWQQDNGNLKSCTGLYASAQAFPCSNAY